MGDTSHEPGSGPSLHQQHHQHQHVQDDPQTHGPKPPRPSPGTSRPSSAGAPFYSQYSTISAPQQRLEPSMSHQSGNPYSHGGNQNQPGPSFNMTAMAGALPEYGPQSTPSSQTLSGASTPAVVYQLQQNLQYPAHGPGQYMSPPAFGGYAPSPYQGYHQPQHGPGPSHSPYPPHQQQMGVMAQQFPHYAQHQQQQQQQLQQYYYYPGATGSSTHQAGLFPNQAGQFQPGYTSFAHPARSPDRPAYGPHGDAFVGGQIRLDGPNQIRRRPSEASPSASPSAIPRGPPRKPKQSGHAMWVGNLPPGARVEDLKDHFSRDATRDIESLFLISKSNCAFVNYRTEAACSAAMQRFHDSRFQGVRLVCRLRRSSAPTPSGVPTAPSSMAVRRVSTASSSKLPAIDLSEETSVTPEQAVEDQDVQGVDVQEKVTEKFFIVKSLTLQDLEQSVLNGIWATQSHNEETLNKAFQAAENVYLIFSANKSGEYFGYARMTSSINADVAEMYQSIPQPEPAQSSDAPKTISTPATEFAPRGRIIDDSARGTIFWEAELSDTDEDEEDTKSADDAPEGAAQVWGKPFKVEWMSTNRLPFYRTRGLRNPWNANREVKIARDGTELETGVGKRLIQMFHRPGPSIPNPEVQPVMLPHPMGGSQSHFQ